MIAGLLDHLWQSTLFAAAAALLTLALRRNGARIRFWLWFAASLKFLLPFALLAMLGGMLARLAPAVHALPFWTQASPHILALQPAAQPFHAPVQGVTVNIVAVLAVAWALGFALVLASRLWRGLALDAVKRGAIALPLAGPVTVKTSTALMEPGLVGVLKPVVLLPRDLLPNLSAAERDAILAHEVSHLRRRDNLTAMIHMLTEALFWFWPPVWLIGARLIAERERACDESVLAQGHDAGVYAGAILQVCKFCVRSPLPCAAGVSGADLGRRIEAIMTGASARRLGAGRKMLLAGAAAAAIALPVAAGFLASPLAAGMRHAVGVAQARAQQTLAQLDLPQGVAVVARQIGIPAALPPVKLPRLKIVAAAMPVIEVAPPPPAPVLVVPRLEPAPLPRQDAHPEAPGPARQVVLALYPSGAGDPDSITCRAPQSLPGSRLPGPEVCQANRVWAALRAQGADIAPDGKSLVATAERPEARGRSLCQVTALLNNSVTCF